MYFQVKSGNNANPEIVSVQRSKWLDSDTLPDRQSPAPEIDCVLSYQYGSRKSQVTKALSIPLPLIIGSAKASIVVATPFFLSVGLTP